MCAAALGAEVMALRLRRRALVQACAHADPGEAAAHEGAP
jgi:hypothetical protein